MSAAAIRSWLFVPGDDARKHDKATASGADALILDLEDSVTAELLPKARTRVRNFLAAHRDRSAQQLWVRVNTLASGKLHDDLVMIMAGAPDGIVLPKISAAREALEIARLLPPLEEKFGIPSGRTKLLVIATETPQALFALGSYADAANPRLAGLTWGAEDLSSALGATPRETSGAYTFTFELVRSMCLLAAGAAAVPAIDSVYVEFKNNAGLAAEAARACRDGFAGKLAIHPAQVPAINAAFSPQAVEVAQAREIVAAFAANPDAGVLALNGQMFDRPHLVKAQRILARAARTQVLP